MPDISLAHETQGELNDRIRRNTTRNVKDQQLRAITINNCTLKDKIEELVDVTAEWKLDILGIAEAKLKGEGMRTVHNGYVLIHTGKSNDTRHGVAILLSPEIANQVINTAYVNERIIGITISLKCRQFDIVQVYAPQQGRTKTEKDQFSRIYKI